MKPFTKEHTTESVTIWTKPAVSTQQTDPPFVAFNSSWCSSVRNLKDVSIDEERFENLKERICFGHNETVKEALLLQMDEILQVNSILGYYTVFIYNLACVVAKTPSESSEKLIACSRNKLIQKFNE